MEGIPNVKGDELAIEFSIDQSMLQALFNSYHRSIRADPVDVYIASLLQSFNSTFSDREAPAVFSEGHGREPWDPSLDISDTVGWFTIMYPIQVPSRDGFDQLVQLVKDQRARLPNKGWSYFTCQHLNEQGREHFSKHWPIEINFNYLGHFQQFERRDALLQMHDFDLNDIPKKQFDTQPRLALIEILSTVIKGKAQISCVYNRRIRHHDKIAEWMSAWEMSLLQAAANLRRMSFQYALRDFPKTSLSTTGLERINRVAERLPENNEIEDVYPCAPIQQGMLIAQIRSPDVYMAKFIYNVVPMSGTVDIARLELAWERVVNYHSIFRTIFMEKVSQAPYDQLVLARFKPGIQRICSESDEFEDILRAMRRENKNELKPQYDLGICTCHNGAVYLVLDINHALIDGTSVGLLCRDIVRAYDDKLTTSPTLKYGTYIEYIQQQSPHEGMIYWASYLKDITPCYLPCLNDGIEVPVQHLRLEMDMTEHLSSLGRFCKQHEVSIANVFQVVWGVVLRNFTNADQISFGYLSSGRDIPLAGIEYAIGPYINMLVCRMDMENSTKVLKLIEKTREDYLESLPYQHISLAEIQHNLKLSKERLFNTVLSVQRDSSSLGRDQSISIELRAGYDPSEVGISLNPFEPY
jgi:non-ribosomal peptide synthase protein (TIGR01720 family)